MNIDVSEIEDGRYDGDLMAFLQHNPSEAKYPFRVLVIDWRGDRWYRPNPILHRWDPEKSFKRLAPAVRHMSDVLHAADLGYYQRQVGKSRNDGFVTL